MSLNYDFDVTVNAGDLLALLAATTDFAGHLRERADNEPDTKARAKLDRRASYLLKHHKPALEAWCEAVNEARGYGY